MVYILQKDLAQIHFAIKCVDLTLKFYSIQSNAKFCQMLSCARNDFKSLTSPYVPGRVRIFSALKEHKNVWGRI